MFSAVISRWSASTNNCATSYSVVAWVSAVILVWTPGYAARSPRNIGVNFLAEANWARKLVHTMRLLDSYQKPLPFRLAAITAESAWCAGVGSSHNERNLQSVARGGSAVANGRDRLSGTWAARADAARRCLYRPGGH